MESTVESFLIECAWCRKVKVEGKWVNDPSYRENNKDKDITHGICPECSIYHFPSCHKNLMAN